MLILKKLLIIQVIKIMFYKVMDYLVKFKINILIIIHYQLIN